ncbi:MAG: prolipoprotein diacylglyceryl transferase [Deltaproteobacteria bacterium]|nr:prolipoprotein diacylglyceryl transferase [Deltaproteobacteria bacterium]MBW1923582.1 prolipoprotein diacylglyceryl transferase [Deltaproteobacteria bacterium]MBW1948574.1 prolipoprotein diacylglyceryl transferase [Deltaproteobacteria bacterium]MBW2006750.1 prolipoprotein diacylglyceryl transferase [Deltaproteobacteria bacterium]MBW2101675.1 prolipoprotein diacylglyceryl transferase [Deltaproteobacteria bacterium]
MIPYPQIDPDLVRIGPIHIRWYGLMYVLGFGAAYMLIRRQKKAKELGLQSEKLQELVFYAAVGLIVGARLGYILFYQFGHWLDYIRNPLEIIAVWHGGMSFHGGLAGTLLAGALFCRSRRLPLWKTADVVVVTAPVGLFLGRIGNFINAELFGRTTTMPWAMVFPGGGPLPRHPSQLYEAFLEGVVLFLFLWWIKDRPFRPGAMVCLFLIGYGALRFLAEFFREPDPQLGLFWGTFSMGQILCTAMIVIGAALWKALPGRRNEAPDPDP